jgi:hypothetical protein
MNIHILTGVAIAALAVSAVANAQQTNERAATYDTPNGPLVVTSGQPAPRDFGPPPPFSNLANGKSYITSDDASGYPLLANDFIFADSNRDGRVSKAEYDRWASAR